MTVSGVAAVVIEPGKVAQELSAARPLTPVPSLRHVSFTVEKVQVNPEIDPGRFEMKP